MHDEAPRTPDGSPRAAQAASSGAAGNSASSGDGPSSGSSGDAAQERARPPLRLWRMPPNVPVGTDDDDRQLASPTVRARPAPTGDTPSLQEKRRRMDRGELSMHRFPQSSEIDEMFLDLSLSHEPALEGWEMREDGILQLTEKHMNVSDRAAFAEAKRKELQSFFDNEVWDYASQVDPTRTMKARFILKWRNDEQGKPEAKHDWSSKDSRIQTPLMGKLETSSPTATRLARQVLLTVAATMRWPVHVADVKTAFLQGRPQDRVLFVRLPADAARMLGTEASPYMLLKKPMYGQTDAPRAWFLEAKDRLLKCGLLAHPLDPCLYLAYDKKGQLSGLVSMHVDDLLIAGCVGDVELELKKRFQFRTWKSLADGPLEYCGGKITWTQRGIELSYSDYLAKVKPITIRHGSGESAAAVTQEKCGSFEDCLVHLQWPAAQGCPHLACSVSSLAANVTKAQVSHLREANKLLRLAKMHASTPLLFPTFEGEGDPQWGDLGFLALSDAAWATRPDGGSQGGYLLLAVPPCAFDDRLASYALLRLAFLQAPTSVEVELERRDAGRRDCCRYARVCQSVLESVARPDAALARIRSAHDRAFCPGRRCQSPV